MRKALLVALPATLAPVLVVAGTASGDQTTAAAIPGCAKDNLNLQSEGRLTIGADNPAFPPWFGGKPKSPWKTSDPRSGQGYESAVAYAIARQLGFTRSTGVRAVRPVVPSRQEAIRLLYHAGLVLARARPCGRLLERVLLP
jgi:hypothetical protein